MVWQDTRVDQLVAQTPGTADRIASAPRPIALASYFSGLKLQWLWTTCRSGAKAQSGDILSAISTRWLLWNLTGGSDGGCTPPMSRMPAATQ